VQRLDMNLAPCAEMEDEDGSCADQVDGNNSDANAEHAAHGAGGAGGRMAWGRDPTHIVETDESSPYQVMDDECQRTSMLE